MAEVVPGDRLARRPTRGRVADQIVETCASASSAGHCPTAPGCRPERELAESYGVSGATVRESVRVLTAMGLISARHGSGSFVTADTSTMIALSIASVVRLENAGVADALGVLAALNRQGRPTRGPGSHRRRDRVVPRGGGEAGGDRRRARLRRGAAGLPAPPLGALPQPAADGAVPPSGRPSGRVGAGTSGGTPANWRQVTGVLQPERLAIVEAVERRSAEEAADLVTAYAERPSRSSCPHPTPARSARSDPGWSRLLSDLLNTRNRRRHALRTRTPCWHDALSVAAGGHVGSHGGAPCSTSWSRRTRGSGAVPDRGAGRRRGMGQVYPGVRPAGGRQVPWYVPAAVTPPWRGTVFRAPRGHTGRCGAQAQCRDPALSPGERPGRRAPKCCSGTWAARSGPGVTRARGA